LLRCLANMLTRVAKLLRLLDASEKS